MDAGGRAPKVGALGDAGAIAESAALLVDDVLPHEPIRQWVLLTRLIKAAPRATVN